MVSRRTRGSHWSSQKRWLPRLLSRLGLIFFVPIANAGYNLQSNDVTLTQDASDTTSPYNYTITFTINNVTGGRNQNDGIESLQLVLDDGSSYCFSDISIAPAAVIASKSYGPYNATDFTNNSSDASLPAGSYSSIQLGLFTDDNCGTQETFANNLALTISVSAPSLHHYAVSYDGGSTTSDVSGSTCTAIPVTIVAHDISDSAVTATTTVTLTTSSGNGIWVANGTSSIDLTFGGATSVTTYLRHTTAGTTTINVTDGSVTESASEDPTLTTSAVGLVITGPGNIVSGLNVDNSTSLTIAEDCTTSGTLATTFYYSCLDPNSCIVGQDLTINDVSISNNSSSPTTVSLTYTSGSSTFDVNFEDVGQVQLFANVTVTASAAADASGSWDTNTTFVSKPATLSLSVAGNSGTEGSGTGFTPAGTDFTITIDAKNSDNANTPNFGQESTPVVPTLSWSWVYPATASLTDSDLSRTTYSTNGTVDGSGTITGNFPKVGTIAINAAIPGNDYLTAGDILNRPSLNVGRFYPNAFELTNNAGATPSVLDACSSSSFTYFDESAIDIDYKITAKNALGDAISNYDAASGYGVATVSIGVESTADDGVNLASRLSGATSSWSSGVYSVDSSSSRFASSGSSPNAELLANVGVIISDSLDGLNLASLDFDPGRAGDCNGSCTGKILPSSLRLRHGRLRLAGASGPETVALPAPLEAQYYNGSGWVRNTLDDCTSFPELIQFGGAALTAGVTVGSGTSTASYTSLASSTVTLVDGTSGLIFSAPGIGNTGSFQIDFNGLSGLEHLKYDWNGGGKEFPSPATITFGSFRGHDKIIGRRASGAQE